MKSKNDYKKSGLYLGIGFVVALSIVITAFEWKSVREIVEVTSGEILPADSIFVKITQQKPPEPPKPKVKPNILEVDEEEIIEDLPDFDVEFDIEDEIPDDFTIDEPEPEPEPDFVLAPEVMPKPKGGYTEFYKVLGKKINYPPQAIRMNVEGTVHVMFIVDKKGKLNDIQVIKGIGAGCDEEAVRALKTMENWNPGKQRGVPVRVRIVLPVKFSLN